MRPGRSPAGSARSATRHKADHTSASARRGLRAAVAIARSSSSDSTGVSAPASCTTGTVDGAPVPGSPRWT